MILFVHSFASGPVIGLHAHPQIVVYSRLVFCDLMALRLPCAWELIVLLPGLFGYWTSGWLAGWLAWLAAPLSGRLGVGPAVRLTVCVTGCSGLRSGWRGVWLARCLSSGLVAYVSL